MRTEKKMGIGAVFVSLVLSALFLMPTGIGRAEDVGLSDIAQGEGEVVLSTQSASVRFYKASAEGMESVWSTTSYDGGSSWIQPVQVSEPVTAIGRIAAGAYGDNVYVAWEDWTAREPTACFASSKNSGLTWSRPVQLIGASPAMAISEAGFAIATLERTGSIALLSGAHGEAGMTVELSFTVSCLEQTVGFDSDGNVLLAFYGGARDVSTGATSLRGLYATSRQGTTWTEPERIYATDDCMNDLFLDEDLSLTWNEQRGPNIVTFMAYLPTLISSHGGIQTVSSEPVLAAPSGTVAPSRLPPKKWTAAIYLDADNSLDSFGFEDFNEMELVGSTADINIIVLFDRNTATDTRAYYVTYDTVMGTIASTQIPLNSINASWGTELNMGNPQTAKDFMKYVYINYPAKYYWWDFWNHGGSWNWAQCSDDSNGGDVLTAAETRSIYERARTDSGRRYPYDIVSTDECILADVEMFYDAKQYCNYTVFSEDSIGGDGFEYNRVLGHIKNVTSMAGEEFAYWMCHEYYDVYPAGPAYTTLAAINNTAFDYDMMPLINSWGQKMRHKGSSLNAAIQSAASSAMDWQGITYQPDMKHYAQLITTGITNATDAAICGAAWKVIVKSASNAYNEVWDSPSWVHNRPVLIHDANTNANGITIYSNEAYETLYNSLKIAPETNWDAFEQNVWGTPSDVTNVEPGCTITSPPNGGFVVYNTVVTITGTASDSDGTVQRAQVKIDREAWQNATGTTSWSYQWNTAGWAPGIHRIQARSWDGTDYSNSYANVNVTEIVDPNLPDLTLWPNQITFSNGNPNEGDTITIGTTIHNVGTVNDATNVQVGFYVGDPAAGGTLIGTYVTTTPSTIVHNNGTGTASTTWNTAGWAGNRQIYVMADPTFAINELTDANNTKAKSITVQGYAVDLACAQNVSTVQAGASHTYPITVTNLGTMTDSIHLTIDNPTVWDANFNNNPGSVPPVWPAERLVSGYHTYAEIQSDLTVLEAAHPSIAKRYNLGTSWEGRFITALKISDNVAANESEPGTLIMGNHHAREWMTVEIPLYYAEYLLNNYGSDPQATWLVNNREIFIVPSVNPDGLQYSQFTYDMWRKNRRNNGDGTYGVDLNRNYDGAQNGDPNGNWGGAGTSHSTSDDTYCGPSAFSEPECQAIRNFVLAHPLITTSISYHSYAEEVYWPWGYSTSVQTPDHTAQQSIATDLAAINGYTPMQSSMLYLTTGDSDDWLYGYPQYQQGGKDFFPFTIETNTEFQPPASEIVPTCQVHVGVNLEITDRADDLYKTAPTIAHTPLENTEDTTNPYVVTASFSSSAGVNASSLFTFWKVGSAPAYTQVAMTPTGTPGQYRAEIPPQADGTWVYYYIQGSSTAGTTSTSPPYAPIAKHGFFIGADIVEYTVTNLASGDSRIVNLTVVAPPSALPNEQAKISVDGHSETNPAKTDSVETVTTVTPAILLVNDGNTAIVQYQAALTNNGYKYDNGTPTTDLSNYRMVIWATDGASTLAASEKTALMTFMDAGGSVYVNGEDVGYDIATDDDTAIGLGPSPNNFYGLYCHATYLADSSGGTLMNGVAGDPITNGMANYDISGSYPEAINALGASASVIFRYNDATTRGAAIKAETANYKFVYIGCEYFEGTTDVQANKDLLMYRIIEWLNPDRVPVITVNAPTSANVIASGTYTIRWTASDDNPLPATPISIAYSGDGGGTWNPIAAGIANSGTYNWDTTARADGVNYLIRVTAQDSIGQAAQDVSDNPFSIDNTLNDQWHLQVQSSIAGFRDLDMKPVELADNTYSSNITAPGTYLIGNQRFASGAMASTVNVQGSWSFSAWGRVSASSANGRLYARVYRYDGVTSNLLFQTSNDDELVGSYTILHNFAWTYSAPSATVPSGQRIVVEIWLDATAGSGNSNVQNLATRDIPVLGTVTGTYLNTQTQDDGYEVVTELAGPATFTIYSNDFESGSLSGWTLGGASNDWQIGTPSGINGDPASAYGGTYSIGNDLTGLGTYPRQYENSLAADSNYIYTPVINCAGYTGVRIQFMRWLGVESATYDHAYIEASRAPGGPWTQIWSHTGATTIDTSWTSMSYSIATVADNQAAVYVRFEMGATDGSVVYCGWNIDNLAVVGNRTTSYLEHKWSITVPAGKSPYTFGLDAYRTTSADNDNFVFAYSTDNVTFTDMVTVTATTDTDAYLTYTLPTTLSGAVYIRVRDTDRTAGRTVLDIIRVDHMYIQSVEGPPQMIIAYDYATHQSYVRPVFTAGGASYLIPVVAGWNLVSTPLIPSSGALPGVLTDSAGDTLWNRAMWYNPLTPNDRWKQYNTGWPGAMNDLTTVDVSRGVWLFVTTVGDGYINVSGTLPTSTGVQLRAGWNLIGYPARVDTTYTVGQLKAATGATTVEGFSAPATYKTIVLADGFVMKRSQAYWVYVPADIVWTVDW
jgi:carboxypeptidase T